MATEDMNTRYVRVGSVAAQVEGVERERDLYRLVVDALREHRDLDAELSDPDPDTSVAAMARVVDLRRRSALAWQAVLEALAAADEDYPPDATRPPTGTGGLEGKGGEGSSDVKPTPSQ